MRAVAVIATVLVAAAGAAFVAFATAEHGLAVSVDSVKYLSTARSVLDGEGFVQFDGEPYVLWPPLYPLAIAAIGLADSGLVEALRIAHVVVFAGIVIASMLLFRRMGVAPTAAVAGATAVAAAPPLVYTVVTVQSELFFVAWVLVYLFAIVGAVERPTRMRIALAGLVVGLATLQRYAGVALAASGVMTFLVSSRSASLRRRVAEAAGFGIVAGLPLAVWLVRNIIVVGSAFGDHPSGSRSLALNARDLVETMTSWFLPASSMDFEQRVQYGLGIVGVATLGLLVSSLRRRRDGPAEPHSANTPSNETSDASADPDRSRRIWLVATLVLVAVYIGFYLTTSTLRHQGRIGHRYMGPVWIPTFGLLLAGLSSLSRGFARVARSRYASWVLPVAALVVWGIALAAPRLADMTDQLRRGGFPGYTAVGWQQSPMLEWLAQSRSELDAPVYTNSTEALYYVAGIRSQALRTRLAHPAKIRDSSMVDRDAVIVWFDPYLSRRPLPKGSFADFDRLGEGATVEPWRRFEDGTIYTVRF